MCRKPLTLCGVGEPKSSMNSSEPRSSQLPHNSPHNPPIPLIRSSPCAARLLIPTSNTRGAQKEFEYLCSQKRVRNVSGKRSGPPISPDKWPALSGKSSARDRSASVVLAPKWLRVVIFKGRHSRAKPKKLNIYLRPEKRATEAFQVGRRIFSDSAGRSLFVSAYTFLLLSGTLYALQISSKMSPETASEMDQK